MAKDKKEEQKGTKSKEGYAVVFNRDGDKIMRLLFGIVIDERNPALAEGFAGFLKQEGLDEQFLALVDNFSDKCHEMGWCEDPDCKYEEENKK